jgi:light-regulated signal transduction histidine kinase (bacteriophytochrome)
VYSLDKNRFAPGWFLLRVWPRSASFAAIAATSRSASDAEICGDSTMLRLVLKDRMSNVVKYTSIRNRAMIEGMRSHAGKAVFSVCSASVQFDSRCADKLIGMLQRLYKEDDVEGLDIAAADVRRIVHRLTGSVWAKGRVGIGASFHFALHRPQR